MNQRPEYTPNTNRKLSETRTVRTAAEEHTPFLKTFLAPDDHQESKSSPSETREANVCFSSRLLFCQRKENGEFAMEFRAKVSLRMPF